MFLASAREAASYGANVFMLYTGAPQNTRRKEIFELNIDAGWEYAHEHGINEIVVHAPYIINLANTVKPETYELAVEFLEKEIVRTAAMKSRILVLHPGSHVNAGEQAGIAQIVKGLNTVLNQNDDDVFIALETMAGKGSEIGRSFEELKAICDGVDRKERLRVCFDTCHVNDAGYDIVNHYDDVLRSLTGVIGLEQIAVFHVNDSLNPSWSTQGQACKYRQREPSAMIHCTDWCMMRPLQMYQRFWKHHGFVRRALRRRLFLLIKRKLNGFLNKKVAKNV